MKQTQPVRRLRRTGGGDEPIAELPTTPTSDTAEAARVLRDIAEVTR